MWVLGSLQGCLPCCASAQPLEKWGLLQSCEGTRMRRVPPPRPLALSASALGLVTGLGAAVCWSPGEPAHLRLSVGQS